MATYKSVAAVQEIEYWLRLATFLHEPLKYALLAVLHNKANDPTYVGLPDNLIQLYQELGKYRNQIAQLVKKRVLQQDQVDLLLPPNDNKIHSTKFDVTLIAILIINFTTLQPPLNGLKDKNPPAHDRSKGAGVIRGRQWRNYVHHTEPKDIDQAEFNKKWTDGAKIISDLGYQYDTNKLKTISLDPKHELVLKSLFSFMAHLQTKHDTLDVKHHILEGKHDTLDAKHDTLEGKHDTLDAKHDTLEGKHDTLEGKHDTLEGKHDTLYTKHSTLEGKHNALEAKNDAYISSLTQQFNKISNEVQYLQDKQTKKEHINSESSSRCLKSVLEYISQEIKENEAEDLLDQLNVQSEGDLVDKLKSVPWRNVKAELEILGRKDIIEYIQRNTLITRGLQNASDKLRDHYMIELIECLVEQPLSSIEMDSQYASREEIYIDLVVLPSSTVDQEWSNSDRDTLMKQNYLNKSFAKKVVDKLIEPSDELIFLRGVAGIGKSTLIDMFTLKWAKKELTNPSMFDFVFKFICRELNQILNEFETLEQLFKLQYTNIFLNVTLEDLAEVSDRVLIIVDGLDELKDIYQMDGVNGSLEPQPVFLKVIYDLMNIKCLKSLKNHKTILCGRPKACEFVKNQFSTSKIKTIEVCGFNHTNVQKYIHQFFDKHEEKAKTVQGFINSSNNLKFMATVPVFLWVICNVYSEDLIKRQINTNTELYFYTCLILLRNHFQGTSKKYKNLLDIINDKSIINVVYSLMVLSVKTYMQNKVLFTDKDIKKLKCPVHLEQTGFIIKYSRSNIKEAMFQFRHLILQEFLCGMYLCVTKRISPFLSNRELSSCLPTILGIYRIIRENKNDIFLQFYRALLEINYKKSNFKKILATPFRNSSYDAFIKTHTLDLPDSMVKNHKLPIPDSMVKNHTLPIPDSMVKNHTLPIPDSMVKNHTLPIPDSMVKNHTLLMPDSMVKYHTLPIPDSMLKNYTLPMPDSMVKNHTLPIPDSMVKNHTLPIPDSMVKNHTLLITDSPDCREFLDLFKESNFDVIAPPIRIAEIQIISYSNLTTILNLFDQLEIAKIRKFEIDIAYTYLDGNDIISEDILRLYDMTADPGMETIVSIVGDKSYSYFNTSHITCSCEQLRVCIRCPLSPNLFVLPDNMKNMSKEFYVGVEHSQTYNDTAVRFIQDVTKYAIDHRKDIYLGKLPDFEHRLDKIDGLVLHKSSKDLSSLLENSNINIESTYIHITGWWDFEEQTIFLNHIAYQ